ncbi:hypothetical protein [Streptomyces sp. AC495_CC817]|uniref:hypothetical protein n=1 Tax=Streptomyces sp. AC495_CC817 TaxID=2823900 RepID=UPI001C272A50|nr:hypothetical protein [Streptomyces sp. AC495_CC817]
MTYADTARAFTHAEDSAPRYPNAQRLDADKLPMSEWAEARRADMTPATIAQNHAAHVSDAAFSLRDALARADQEANPIHRLSILADVEDGARALLAAIGEGEA